MLRSWMMHWPNARSRPPCSRSLVVSRLHFWLRMSLGRLRFTLLIAWMWSGSGNRCWALTGRKTLAASNSIYVTRQNNVVFSVLAQYFGPEAINDRLILIE